jgi:hypothetical protein
MASRILKTNYPVTYIPNLTAVPTDLRYDPENGNVELVQQGPGGQVLYKNGEFTEQGTSVLQVNETGSALEDKIINDVRSAATTTGGKLQPWSQNPATAQPAPADVETGDGESVGGLTQLPSELFGKKENFGNLMYPKNMNSGQDRIFITQFKYKRTDVIQREGDFSALENIVGSVTLPMPNDISETNSVGWGDNSLSNIAALSMPKLVEAGLKAGEGDITGAVNDGFAAVRNTLMNGSTGRRLQQFLAVNAAASVVKKFGVNVDPEAFIVRSTGAAINPNLELLFNGPKLRQFGFQFKMTPRSKEEAIQIRKIIRFFKQGMSPRKGIGEASFFLGTPNVFKLKFKSGENELKSIGKIKTCALLSFAVNYTPDGFYAAYEDASANGSQPISVTMQLGFTELTPVFNDEFDDNYDDIGPNIFPKNNFSGFTDDAGNESTSGNEEVGRSGPPTPGTRTARG